MSEVFITKLIKFGNINIQIPEYDVLIISEVDDPDKIYPCLKFRVGFNRYSEGGGFTYLDTPAKVMRGELRSNICYTANDVGILNPKYLKVSYINRYDGFFKITSMGNGDYDGRVNIIVREHWHLFIHHLYKYRHKSIHDLRELTIMKIELDQL